MVSLAPPIRTRSLPRARRWPLIASGPAADTAAVFTLLALSTVASWDLVVGGTMVGQDTAAFFYPIFSALGKRLAAGDIPGWNPHQFAGIPFAADPESGWMYLPAMFFFTLLPLAAAAKAWLLFHLLLAGFATYGLGRALGMGTLGALTAAVAYEFSGLLYARNICCPAYSQVLAWLPALLLGTEMAIRSRTWPVRVGWWGAAGLALSQILVAWLGQGAYYAVLAFGGYVLYRTVIAPPERSFAMKGRLLALIFHGAAPFVIGLLLSSAAILPRLEYHARSNLAEGYTGDLAWAAVLGGWDGWSTIQHLLGRSLFYPGVTVLALACAALLVSHGRYAAPCFAVLAAGALILAQRETTWLHQVPYALLPRFKELHQHWPERVLVIFYLGLAMLAGATVSVLARRERPALLAATAVPVLVTLAVAIRFRPVTPLALFAGFVAVLSLLIVAQVRGRAVRWLVLLLLVLIIFVDLLAAGRFNIENGPFGGFHKVDLATYYAPSKAAAFLRAQAENGQPVRFLGYDPGIHPGDDTPQLYRFFFADPRTTALLLNNRATVLGLEDVQGYNPIQPQRYVAVMRALNGFAQEYHEANVYPSGLDSPLLDLLNARYILVPAAIPPGRADLEWLVGQHPTVYADDQVRVLENREALPRAWIVHEARQVATPEEALALLASGAVDPRRVVLLEEPPPRDVAPPRDPATDEATVTLQEPDHLRVTARSDAPGLLVLSETTDPGWQAELDGEPVSMLTANHLLRAVPVPAGEHIIELRYESTTLKVGTAVSLLSYAGLVGVWIAAAWASWQPARQRRRCS